jgi:hypothetical protein
MASRRTPEISRPADPAPPSVSPTASPLRGRKPAPPRAEVSPDERRRLIAERAYLRAERRGFTPGFETEDWLAAEVEVDALLKVSGSSPQ